MFRPAFAPASPLVLGERFRHCHHHHRPHRRSRSRHASSPAHMLCARSPQPAQPPQLNSASVDDTRLSPMMRHYVRTRRRLAAALCAESHRPLVVLYRVGDFFETFFEDAHALSALCGLALTSKDGGKALGCRVPMAGLPHFCLDDKAAILLANNVTVAVVDQVSFDRPENNKNNRGSGGNNNALVHRAVTRLLTPATTPQNATRASYVAAVCVAAARAASRERDGVSMDRGDSVVADIDMIKGTNASTTVGSFTFGFAYADACGGEFRATEDTSIASLLTLLATRMPVELIITAAANNAQSIRIVEHIARDARRSGIIVTVRTTSGAASSLTEAEDIVCSFHAVDNVESLGCRGQPLAVMAAAEVLTHLTQTLSVNEASDADSYYSANTRTSDSTMSSSSSHTSSSKGSDSTSSGDSSLSSSTTTEDVDEGHFDTNNIHNNQDTITTNDVEGTHNKISLNPLTTFTHGNFLQLDEAALRNLEILESARDASRHRSLQWAVDRTITCMGARRLRAWLVHPLAELNGIVARHAAVDALLRDAPGRDDVQTRLASMPDLERVAGRVAAGRITPRELRWLAECVLALPALFDAVPKQVLSNAGSLDVDFPKEDVNSLVRRGWQRPWRRDGVDGESEQRTAVEANGYLTTGVEQEQEQEQMSALDRLIDMATSVVDALADPAPSSLPSPDSVVDAGTRVFRVGYDDTLDKLRAQQSTPTVTAASSSSSSSSSSPSPPSWITVLEERERKRTGIDSLRIKHVRNSGYVIRLPRAVGERRLGADELYFSNLGYERVQSTKVELRFTFGELRAHARAHAVAVAEVIALERRLFFALCDTVRPFVTHIRQLGALLACIDVVAGFATVAAERGYVRPEMVSHDDDDKRCCAIVDIVDVRHAVVEQMLPPTRSFVANSLRIGGVDDNHDVNVDVDTNEEQQQPQLLLLCGPNAAGKSCALRSIGLTVVLAQAGCFVPARRAALSVSDRVLTRVGAVDDVANGQSTFQVEMAETACILSHAGPRSIVLLDEIGRGTSTADGIAIAWSVAEELSQRPKDKAPLTMFVTHFHELNHLATLYPNVEALHVVMQSGSSVGDGGVEELVSTHVIRKGPSYQSLGINTAQRAGFPPHVVRRATLIADIVSNPCKAVGQRLQLALTTADKDGDSDVGAQLASSNLADYTGSEGVNASDGREQIDDESVSSSPGGLSTLTSGTRPSFSPDKDSFIAGGVRNGYEQGFDDGYQEALGDVERAMRGLRRLDK